MNAPASITITPVRVADLLAEGERMPVYVHVIDHPDARVLVDTGITELHPAVADLDPRLRPLSRQDFDLAGIDIVVNTHLHFDHCGGNHLFAGRPIYVQRRELDDARSEDDYTIREWVEAPGVRYVPVDGELELLPGLRLVPAPGHTRGMQVIVVETGGRPVVVGGDVAVWFGELDEPHTEGQLRVRALDPELVWLAHEHEPWRPATDESSPAVASLFVKPEGGEGRMQPRVLLDGLAMPESPRWHDGRLWFSNWGTREIVAVDVDGNSEVVGEGPDGLGWATNWLPGRRLLVTGPELMRVEPDGSRVRHADLSHISPHGWSELTVDGRGNVYVNTINFDFADFNEVLTSGRAPGKIALVTPDGEAREVANELAFPNGMVITPDNKTLVVAESFAARLTAFDIEDDGSLSNRRIWADGVGPDGICLDADGCIWASSANMANDCARIREGGEVLERIDLGRPCFATMLGGPDRRTLFMLTADWRGTEAVGDVIKARTGQVLVADAPAPGAGWP